MSNAALGAVSHMYQYDTYVEWVVYMVHNDSV